MIRSLSRALCTVAALAVLVTACGNDATSPSNLVCKPRVEQPCYLADGALGVAVCNAAGKALGACAPRPATGGCASLGAACCPSLATANGANGASCDAVASRGDDDLCDVYLGDARAVGLCPEGGGSGEGPAYGPICVGLANECCATLPAAAVEPCLARAFGGDEQRCQSFLALDAQGSGFCAGVDHTAEACAFLAQGCCPTLPDGARDRCAAVAVADVATDCLGYLGSVADTNHCPSLADPPAVAGACASLLEGCCGTIDGQTAVLCDLTALAGDEAECAAFEVEVKDLGFCGGSVMPGCGDTSSDVLNCGLCGFACGTDHAVPSCAGGVCSLACEIGFGDCDADPSNGCEVDFASDPASCGSCFHVCGTDHASAACVAGQCSLTCDAGFGDCDGNPVNGCEADLSSHAQHCGACGNDCSGAVCEAMTCGLAPELLASNLEVPSALGLLPNDLVVVGAQPLGGVAVRFTKLGGSPSCLGTGDPPSSGTCGFGVWNGVVVDGPEIFVTGSTGVTRFTTPFGETAVATNVPQAYAIALDTDTVFFTSMATGGVFKVARNAVAASAQEITGMGSTPGGALAVDEAYVYWTHASGAVFRLEKDGKNLQQIASSQAFDATPSTPQSLGIDEQWLFWTTQGGRILRLKKDGSELLLLADTQAGPSGLFVEPGPLGAVYWVNRQGGTVRRMAKDGSSATTLAAGQSEPITVIADDVSVYWATAAGTAWKTAK